MEYCSQTVKKGGLVDGTNNFPIQDNEDYYFCCCYCKNTDCILTKTDLILHMRPFYKEKYLLRLLKQSTMSILIHFYHIIQNNTLISFYYYKH